MEITDEVELHLVMFPWLAFGHIIPFLELSKCLAKRGHHISFISTPKNIARLPDIPPDLSPKINLVELPFPHVEGLPKDAEATRDIPLAKIQYLFKALDRLEEPLSVFLEHASPTPDWIIYDIFPYWVSRVATKFKLPCAHFGAFSAAMRAFNGPPPTTMMPFRDPCSSPEQLTVVPPWLPFPSNVVYRSYEARLSFQATTREDASGVSLRYRIFSTLHGCDLVVLRSCTEFEPDWLGLLGELFQKPVLPVGLLPPSIQEDTSGHEKWVEGEWLDQQTPGSVVYVGFGSELLYTTKQIHEIAFGLELSGLPFVWALRIPPDVGEEMLPMGFEDRTKGRGLVCKGWVPQLKFLAHLSIGGFFCHGGWGSVIEALGFGKPLILLPMIADQPLNSRVMEEKKIGVEVPRNESDGSFTRNDIAKTLKLVMVEAKGEEFRAKAREVRKIFSADNQNHGRHIDGFVQYLKDHRSQHGLSSS